MEKPKILVEKVLEIIWTLEEDYANLDSDKKYMHILKNLKEKLQSLIDLSDYLV